MLIVWGLLAPALSAALDRMPRQRDDDWLRELRWLERWQGRYRALTNWVEDHIEEIFTFYRLPLAHHEHMKSTNLLERSNGELRRRTRVIRVFPSEASFLRLIRVLAVETHEAWLEDSRYLNLEYWREHRKQALRQAA